MDAFTPDRCPFDLKPDSRFAGMHPLRYSSSELLMSRRFLVQVDIELLRSHLSQADREEKSREQIVQFLIDSGFRQTPGGWIVSEADLGVLEPEEVTAIDELPDDPS